jgi:hypothetical protein
MPMIYVSEKTLRIIEQVVEHLRKNVDSPGRIMKTDVIHVALKEYAKKLGLKVN